MGSKQKGKPSKARFVQLYHYMLATPAWRSLGLAARAVYVALAVRYMGENNGFLTLSAREAADACGISKSTAARAFLELEDRGFIETVTPSGFSRKDRQATVWRLTVQRCDRTHQPPKRAFLTWKPSDPPV